MIPQPVQYYPPWVNSGIAAVKLAESAVCQIQIVRGQREIQRVWPRIAKLHRDAGVLPEVNGVQHFVCLSRLRDCAPVILAAWQGSELVGAVYAGEPHICGLPVGVVAVGYSSEGQTVVSRDAHTTQVLGIVIKHLAGRRCYHTVYVRDRSSLRDWLPEILSDVPSICFQDGWTEANHTLLLGDSFESLLSSFGRRIRRNLTYYRRCAARAGVKFQRGLSSKDISNAFSHLAPRQRTSRYSVRQLRTRRRALDQMPGSFWYGLRTSAGEWLSLIGGWRREETAYIALQVNNSDAAYDHISISAVSRSYLVEELIRVGVRKLKFLGGCQGLLEGYCVKETWCCAVIEKTTWAATAIRTVGRKILKAGVYWHGRGRALQCRRIRSEGRSSLAQIQSADGLSGSSSLT
jgi:hypothetical protein